MRFVPEGLTNLFKKKSARVPDAAAPTATFSAPSSEITPPPVIQPLNPTDAVSRPADFAGPDKSPPPPSVTTELPASTATETSTATPQTDKTA